MLPAFFFFFSPFFSTRGLREISRDDFLLSSLDIPRERLGEEAPFLRPFILAGDLLRGDDPLREDKGFFGLYDTREPL